MKNKSIIAFLLLSIFFGCTYKHEGELVKDIYGKIYKLERSGRTSESYHLILIDTVTYEDKFSNTIK